MDVRGRDARRAELLADDQLELIRLLRHHSVVEAAARLRLDRRLVRLRVLRVIAILEQDGQDVTDLRQQLSWRRPRVTALSDLQGAEREQAARLFGPAELSPTVCSVRRLRAAFARRCGVTMARG